MAATLLRYQTNGRGEINMLDTPSGTDRITGNENPYDRMSGYEWPENVMNPYYSGSLDMFDVYIGLNGTTVIFYVDDSKGEAKRCEIKNLSFVRDNKGSFSKLSTGSRNYYVEVYDVSENGLAGAVVIRPTEGSSGGGFGKPSDTEPAVISSISPAVNTEDEITAKVVLFTGGEYKTYYLSSDIYEEYASTGKIEFLSGKSFAPKRGDVVYYRTSADEIELTAVWLAYRDSDNPEERIQNIDILSPTSHYDDSFFIGTVKNTGDGLITILGDPVSKEAGSLLTFKLSGTVTVCEDGARELYGGEVYDIISEKTDPANASRVFIATDDIKPTTIIVFK